MAICKSGSFCSGENQGGEHQNDAPFSASHNVFAEGFYSSLSETTQWVAVEWSARLISQHFSASQVHDNVAQATCLLGWLWFTLGLVG